ncbi:hypothetical protein CABS01_09423 [Colletotrichum abscissum]|uniref:uncharacterized protein n=1 Tax=Colletotrichum abscissum TaxID=1671311 RepID=UPI0027D48EC5|nr:uncharacterized protein CABS01_09423 [Colletotrichum abscissum]KAK1502812.1 hypothetical protein CABS01_09423 [Colletotrichum abscissum]
MDPIGALGLASNVVQFVDFAWGILKSTVEIHRSASGSTAAVSDLETLYGELKRYLDQLTAGCNDANYFLNFHAPRSGQGNLTLRTMLTLSQSDCEKLLEVVKSLKSPVMPQSSWRSFRAALRHFLAKNEIEYMEDRLRKTQMGMTLQIITIASQAQDLRTREIKELQEESRKLQLDQAAKFDSYALEMRTFAASVIQFQDRNRQDPPPSKEIDCLGERLEAMSLSHASIRKEQDILKSLCFDAQLTRHENIPAVYQKTFEWVYQPQGDDQSTVSNFAQWLKSDEQFFWLSGKPGSGKSTFMKFVSGEVRTRDLLLEWAKTSRVIIASHYFWSAGTDMQKSEYGLLRTLLYDIFRQCSDLILPMCSNKYAGSGGVSEIGNLSWTLNSLRDTLRKVAAHDEEFRVCLFVDGLDEYDGDHAEMCEVLKSFVETSRIKMCVSSRPWNDFEAAFGRQKNKLYIQDLTRNDILEYIRGNLQRHERWEFLEGAESQGEDLILEIEQRASGVFLWVYLVVKQLRKGLTNHDSLYFLRESLRRVPVELDKFFTQILNSVDVEYHERMATTLQIAVAANEPLHAMAYDFHDNGYEDKDYFLKLPIQPYAASKMESLRIDTEKRLDSRSRGLLEINRRSGTVTFLHRTVMDFLRTAKMTVFLAERAPEDFNIQLCLLKIYASMTKAQVFGQVSRKEFGVYRQCDLQSLVKRCLDCEAVLCESLAAGAETHKILDELDRALLLMFSTGQATLDPETPPTAFLREQVIADQHIKYMSWKLAEDPNYLSNFDPSLLLRVLTPKDSHQETRLDKQWRPKGPEMVNLILKTQDLLLNKCQWNVDPRKNWTAWTALVQHATAWNREENLATQNHFWELMEQDVFYLFLNRGADANAIIWVNVREGWPVFGAFLNLAFEVSTDIHQESLYIRTLKKFSRINGILDESQIRSTNISIQERLGNHTRIRSTRDIFLGRLVSMPDTDLEDCNLKLLAKAVDILGFRNQINERVRALIPRPDILRA